MLGIILLAVLLVLIAAVLIMPRLKSVRKVAGVDSVKMQSDQPMRSESSSYAGDAAERVLEGGDQATVPENPPLPEVRPLNLGTAEGPSIAFAPSNVEQPVGPPIGGLSPTGASPPPAPDDLAHPETRGGLGFFTK